MNYATRNALKLLVMLSFAGLAASASPIAFTESTTGSGTLGSNSFTNALITVSLVGDSSNVIASQGGLFLRIPGTITINVSGLGAATISGNVFVSQAPNPSFPSGIAAGFFASGSGSILDTYNNAFASYGLASPIGPLTGAPFFRPDLTFATSLGGLNITSAGTATFSATAVPEPASGLLTLAGLGIFVRLVLSSNRSRSLRPDRAS